MIEQKTIKLSSQVSRVSVFLTRDFSSSVSLERNLEKKSLDLKRKLVEDRGRILTSIASRGRGKQTGGGIGAALGLLGIGGGGLLRRGLKRTPNSPNQLLRMQKGTSNLSRASKLGKLARPLAVVGTGLDFIGRKAEGQTNVQAGVGAAGGLAGAIGGAKIGAAIGTAILPGAGTAIGGVGGSIIGSLSGGRIADLFTGANRRRQFEEERVVLRNQKTQFSEALDDFDNALDKFEDVVGGLAIRRGGDDDGVIRRRKRPSGLPKPPSIGERLKKFADKPSVQAIGVTATIAGLITLAVLTRGKSATKSQTIIQELLKKTPALKNFTQKEQIVGLGKILERTLSKSDIQKIRMSTSPFLTKRGTVVPGQKGAPGKFIKKRNIVKENVENKKMANRLKDLAKRAKEEKEFNFKEQGKIFREEQKIKSSTELLRRFIRGEGLGGASTKVIKENSNMVFDLIRDLNQGGMLSAEQAKAVKVLEKLLQRRLRQLNNPQFNKDLKNIQKVQPQFSGEQFKSLDELLKNILEGVSGTPLSAKPSDNNLNDLGNFEPNSSNIALAPMGNILFAFSEKKGDTINVVKNESNLSMEGRNVDPTATAYKYFELVQGLTA